MRRVYAKSRGPAFVLRENTRVSVRYYENDSGEVSQILAKQVMRVAPATMSDVAQLAGVGKMTVSRVINKSGYVGKETEQRVLRAIAKLGFRPNEIARSLKGGRSNTIGIIVPDLGDNFFAMCANEAQKVAAAHGYLSLITSSERDEAHEADEIELLCERNMSGLLIVPTRRRLPPLLQFYARGLPIVAFGRQFLEFPCDDVLVDNIEGAYQATLHLLEHGHTRIACVGYDEATGAVQDRITGYRMAMRSAKLPEHVFTSVDSLERTIELIRSWRLTQGGPTAIFTLNNVATMNLHLAFKQLAVNVPQDYAVIGFDDLEYWKLFACPVTAVRQSSGQLGKRAAELLFERLANPDPAGSGDQHIVLPVDLIIRNSCGCSGPERVIRVKSEGEGGSHALPADSSVEFTGG